jgi:sec-independent protein translocase protein TatB
MIDISLGKMLLLAVIALIVLGPEKLPAAARTAGALLRRARAGWEGVRNEVERELELEEIKRAAKAAAAQAEEAQAKLNATMQQVRDPFTQAASTFSTNPLHTPLNAPAAAPGAPAVTQTQASGTVASTPAPEVAPAPTGESALGEPAAVNPPGTDAPVPAPTPTHAPEPALVGPRVTAAHDVTPAKDPPHGGA